MQSYTILPGQDGHTYTVATKNRSGGWQKLREFTTLAEAEAWITQEERLAKAANPFHNDPTTSTKRGW